MMTLRSTVVAVVVAFVILTSVAYAAAPQKAAPPKTVTLELTDTTVVEAIESMFKGTSLSYILQPGVGGTISSLRLKDVSFDKALNALTKAAGLEVVVEEGVYLIGKNLNEPVVTERVRPKTSKTEPAGDVTSDLNEPAVNYPVNEVGPMTNIPMGPYPEGGPVYYGQMNQPGPYGYGMPNYGYGYNNYNYNNYGYPQVYVPSYSSQRPVMLPRPGVSWSAGIGRVQVISPQNGLTPVTPR